MTTITQTHVEELALAFLAHKLVYNGLVCRYGEAMAIQQSSSHRIWTVAEAKAKLSEILRLAETEGPQRIGARKPFVVIPERVWQEHAPPPRMSMGRWLIENMPRGTNLEIPERDGDSRREVPFEDWGDGYWDDK